MILLHPAGLPEKPSNCPTYIHCTPGLCLSRPCDSGQKSSAFSWPFDDQRVMDPRLRAQPTPRPLPPWLGRWRRFGEAHPGRGSESLLDSNYIRSPNLWILCKSNAFQNQLHFKVPVSNISSYFFTFPDFIHFHSTRDQRLHPAFSHPFSRSLAKVLPEDREHLKGHQRILLANLVPKKWSKGTQPDSWW